MFDPIISRVLTFRNRHFLVLDVLFFLCTPALALVLCEENIAALFTFSDSMLVLTTLFLGLKVTFFYFAGLYNRYWRYVGVDDLATTAVTVIAVMCAQTIALLFVMRPLGWVSLDLPRSILVIEGLLVLLLTVASRSSLAVLDRLREFSYDHIDAKRVLVVGAGKTGIAIVKEMQANPRLNLYPVGFVDDNPQKYRRTISGLKVLGDHCRIPELVRRTRAQLVIITMPTAPGKLIREIVAVGEQAGVRTKIIPGMGELLDGKASVTQLRDVQIEDLLRRKPIHTDTAAVDQLIRGKRVLVTGAGGSIGSELCRQVLRYGPSELVLLGHGENSIFEVQNELSRLISDKKRPSTHNDGHDTVTDHPSAGSISTTRIETVIADIRFYDRIRSIFEEYRPEIVFHAAAHKHVPLMEINSPEAITNNVIGTYNLVECALAVDVEHFVMISTDKAVKPSSIMGASKRVAEWIVHRAAKSVGKPYVAVRFGNVLGSRGSVVLTFKQQIARGGPVTVTHPDMQRFFMMIPEAVELALQAATLGSGGEVFALDMGESIKIVDLAKEMIELSGLKVGRDIDIVFTGIRPGEKLYEELFISGETCRRTQHEKILIASNGSEFVPSSLAVEIEALENAARQNDKTSIERILQTLIPEANLGEHAGENWAPRLSIADSLVTIIKPYRGPERRKSERRQVNLGPPSGVPERRRGDRRCAQLALIAETTQFRIAT